MRKFFYFLIALILLIIIGNLAYKLFRENYVRFPTWSMDTRYEILSVDKNFITIKKPLSMTNSMFFPIKFNLGALQVTDYEGKLVALVTINESVILEEHSVTDINLRISVPVSLLNIIDFSEESIMSLYFDGTIQGSVYRIPFTKKLSGNLNISPSQNITNDIFKPLLMRIMSEQNLIKFKGATIIGSQLVRMQFIANSYGNINVSIKEGNLKVNFAGETIETNLRNSFNLNSAIQSGIIEFDIKYSDWLKIRNIPRINFKGLLKLYVFGMNTELEWQETIDNINNYLM